VALQERITQRGIEAVVREVCQLSPAEEDIVTAVAAAYAEIKNMRPDTKTAGKVNVP
jgi:hypothetical protein